LGDEAPRPPSNQIQPPT
jgi:hypothetical protein